MLGDKRSHSLFDEQPSPVSPPEGQIKTKCMTSPSARIPGAPFFLRTK